MDSSFFGADAHPSRDHHASHGVGQPFSVHSRSDIQHGSDGERLDQSNHGHQCSGVEAQLSGSAGGEVQGACDDLRLADLADNPSLAGGDRLASADNQSTAAVTNLPPYRGGNCHDDPASHHHHAVANNPGSAGADAHAGSGTQSSYGVGNPPPPGGGDGRTSSGAHPIDAVAVIVDLWRQRVDLARARQRLDLQCQALCRRVSDGDKAAAGKLWTAIQKAPTGHPVEMVLLPYRSGMEPLEARRKEVEKQLAKLVRPMPLWTSWGADIRGLGEGSFAGLIGEAGRPLSNYRSVSALWKRFGLAVIGGERQRRVADAAAALEHGYAPQRRSYAYVLSTNLMKSQRAATEDAPADPYRALYNRRKAYELERGIPKAHAHNRAMRVMVKELLKHAWVAARAVA